MLLLPSLVGLAISAKLTIPHENAVTSISTNEIDADDFVWHIRHDVTFNVATTSARLNCYTDIYFNLAVSGLDDFYAAQALLNDDISPADPNWNQQHYIRTTAGEAVIRTIVFSAMCCEAAIFDLTAIHLSDKYAAEVIDKLDVVNKWIVVPSLICGTSMNPNGPAINALRTLTRKRNALVHHKSLPIFGQDPDHMARQIAKAQDQSRKISENIDDAVRTVVLLSLELYRLLGTISTSLPSFASTGEWGPVTKRSAKLEQLVARCREIDAKAATSVPRDIYNTWIGQ